MEESYDTTITNNMNPTNHACIGIGTNGNIQSMQKVFYIYTVNLLNRIKITPTTMSDHFIKKMNDCKGGRNDNNIYKIHILNHSKESYDWTTMKLKR